MAGKYGVKETLEIFDLGHAVVKAGVEAAADGKVNILDIGVVLPLIPKVSPALQDADKSLLELAEMDQADSAAVLNHAQEKLGEVVKAEDVKKKVVVCLKVGLAVAEAVAVFKA